MAKTKHDKGLCCFFGCQNKATIRRKTPGYNQRDNEEQLFCQHHWEGNLKLIGHIDQQLTSTYEVIK